MQFKIARVDNGLETIRTTLEELHLKCFPSDEMYDMNRGDWWVAYSAIGLPVAFAGISNPEAGVGYLCRCGVLAGFRGFGLQKRLIRCRVAHAKKMGYNCVITDTTNNPASANSLIKAGFKMYTPAAPWGFTETIYWKLDAAV